MAQNAVHIIAKSFGLKLHEHADNRVPHDIDFSLTHSGHLFAFNVYEGITSGDTCNFESIYSSRSFLSLILAHHRGAEVFILVDFPDINQIVKYSYITLRNIHVHPGMTLKASEGSRWVR